MQNLTGLSEVANGYDGILFDIFGVIHNGVACFDGAVAALEGLQAAGIPYAFLSNMPLRAESVSKSLMRRGVPERLVGQAITSGEAVFQALSAGGFGKTYAFQGPESTRGIVPVGYAEAPVEAADFVLVSGIGDEEGPADYTDLLATALARNLPMLCANPDLKVGHGERMVSCAGLLVDAYARMGGDARWMGKPHKVVFEMARDLLGGKLLMVGDSLRTDIAGAKGAGLDTLFIRSGIHASAKAALFDEEGISPTYALPQLCW
jgi:HAD superfamily hydrolase (TIGR01459 family)